MSSETKELRVDIPIDLMRALDAVAMTNDQERNKFIVAELEKIVVVAIHKATLLNSMLRGNPLLTASERKHSDGAGFGHALRSQA